MNPTLRKHFYDKHCVVVGDVSEREELQSLKQMKREEAEKIKHEKRHGCQMAITKLLDRKYLALRA